MFKDPNKKDRAWHDYRTATELSGKMDSAATRTISMYGSGKRPMARVPITAIHKTMMATINAQQSGLNL